MEQVNTQVENSMGLGRLFILGAASIILCMSFIMAIFTPFPLSLASILYGRSKGYLLGGVCLVLFFFVSAFLLKQYSSFVFYACSFFIAIGITEVVRRRIKPMRGVTLLGLLFIFLSTGLSYSIISYSQFSLRNYLIETVKQNSEEIERQKEIISKESNATESTKVLNLLSNPEQLVDEFLRSFPSYFFMTTFFLIWANLFLVLKSSRILSQGALKFYSEKKLLHFKTPEFALFILIPSLLLTVWGDDLGLYPWLDDVGLTLVKCLGVFYFFQGFGLYVQLLDHIRIGGLLRTFLVIFTVITAAWLLALIGLFDYWFNFKKFFKKKTNE